MGGDAGGDAAEPDGDADALDGLGERLLEMSLQLYCRSRRNDYFMLHGVTACFTLLPLLPLLPAAEAAQAGRRMVAALIATFAAQQANSATKLLLPHPQPQPREEEEERRGIGGGCGKVVQELAAEAGSWGEVVSRLLATPKLLNEHQYKMAWLGQLYSDYSRDGGGLNEPRRRLTSIPDVLLLAAAQKAASQPIAGRTGEQPLPPVASF
jgi:hypothetical protein